MKALTSRQPARIALTSAAGALLLAACAPAPADAAFSDPAPETVDPAAVRIEAPPGTPRPPFAFAPDDAALLDEIQHACVRFFMDACDPATGMVYDRTSTDTISVAGVGFQLSSLPIAVERGWVDRDTARARALLILRALEANPLNRKHGVFYHFLQPGDAGPRRIGEEKTVSTIDTALLFAGMLTAGAYFGGEVDAIATRLVEAADWRAFLVEVPGTTQRFVSLGWKPLVDAEPIGDGRLLPYAWVDSGDEHRLVGFIGQTPPDPARALDPSHYYALRRMLGRYADTGLFVWFPWSGALFTKVFAHCWIDYAHMPPDDPAAHAQPFRVPVDWWENSRRAVRMHQRKAQENPVGHAALHEHSWGLTASDVPAGYGVPGVFPSPVRMRGATPERDESHFTPRNDFGDGTIAPYGPAMAIMFDPARALAALRHARELRDAQGDPVVWRDPAQGGFGFLDAYNPDRNWVAHDYVAIDQGPMLLAIENARTGLVWRLFHDHPLTRRALQRLALPDPAPHAPPAPFPPPPGAAD